MNKVNSITTPTLRREWPSGNGVKIGIVGGGVVGKAIAAYYPGAKIYDKYLPQDLLEEVATADYIFIAVPTPFTLPPSPPYQGGERRGGGQDLTEMDDAVETLVKHLPRLGQQILIIKSTVLPGTTEAYQKRYSNVNFVFSPEFLTQKTAVFDFANPDKQLVGYTFKTQNLALKVLKILPPAPYQKVMPAKVAEMVKYVVNCFYAFKVIFANQIYDLCQALGINYEEIHEGLVADKRIVDSHFAVMHDGYRGYDGKCLPKDNKTLAWFARQKNVELNLVERVIEINEKLTGKKHEPR